MGDLAFAVTNPATPEPAPAPAAEPAPATVPDSTPPAPPAPALTLGEVDAIIAVLARFVPPGYLTSLVRTVVPMALAAALSYAGLHWHILVGVHPSPGVVTFAVFLVFTALYAAARWLENRTGTSVLAKAARGLARLLLSLGVPTTPPQYNQQ